LECPVAEGVGDGVGCEGHSYHGVHVEYQYQIKILRSLVNHADKRLGATSTPTEWVDVTKEEFMNAERLAGFYSQHPGEPATHFFSGNNIEGRTVPKGQRTDG
jgi:hypothetical protein